MDILFPTGPVSMASNPHELAKLLASVSDVWGHSNWKLVERPFATVCADLYLQTKKKVMTPVNRNKMELWIITTLLCLVVHLPERAEAYPRGGGGRGGGGRGGGFRIWLGGGRCGEGGGGGGISIFQFLISQLWQFWIFFLQF